MTQQAPMCRRFWYVAGSALFGGFAALGLATVPSFPGRRRRAHRRHRRQLGRRDPDRLRVAAAGDPQRAAGTVFGVFNTATMGFAMLGMTLYGWAADRFGPVVSVHGVGAVKLLTAGVVAALIPFCGRLVSEAQKAAA